MEIIEVIFKVGMEFYKACKEYLLIKKVDELRQDIELVKGSFFNNALDFVDKASVCENDNNARFFLESAYNNFSQSVKMYADSVDKLLGATTLYTIKSGLADSVKSEGINILSRYYNKAVKEVEDKATASDKAKVEQSGKECEVLEMSLVGKAMCEYYMKEYTLCLNSIDTALGVNYMPSYKTLVANPIFNIPLMRGNRMTSIFTGIFWRFFSGQCVNYLQIMKEIASDYGVSLDRLPYRERIIKLLQEEQNRCEDDFFNNFKRRELIELLS